MTVITYDAVTDIISALTTDWGAAPTPTVAREWDTRSVGLDPDTGERIIVKALPEMIKPFQLHGDNYWHEVPIKIDIRTYSTIVRHNTVVQEASRIIKNILRRSAQGFVDVIIIGSEEESYKVRNMFRHIITLKYRTNKAFTFT